MKIFRFMSKLEFIGLCSGKDLANNKNDFKILKYCECPQHNIFNNKDFEWIDYND